MKVAVYGTLKRGEHNNGYLRGAEFVREDRVNNFMLKNSGFPAAMPQEDSQIVVEVWDIGDVANDPDARRRLSNCDMLEGYNPNREDNHFYVRQEVTTLSGENVQMYVGHPESFEHNRDWPHVEEEGVKIYSWHR